MRHNELEELSKRLEWKDSRTLRVELEKLQRELETLAEAVTAADKKAQECPGKAGSWREAYLRSGNIWKQIRKQNRKKNPAGDSALGRGKNALVAPSPGTYVGADAQRGAYAAPSGVSAGTGAA